RGDQVGLQLSALICPGDDKISLVAQAQIHLLLKLIEEGNAFPDQLDFLDIVELQPEGAGSYRSGQGRERRPLLQNDRPQPRTLRKQRGCATDDPPTDDDELGGVGRLAALDDQ